LGYKLPEDQQEFTTIQDIANFVKKVKVERQA
jgi:hypothetical protein